MIRRAISSTICVALALSLTACACQAESAVTPDEFGTLATGMTLEQANDAIGEDAVKVGESPRSDGKLEERYAWKNADGSWVEAVFIDGKLTEKSSEDLE